jgi:serine/threonine protein kinase
MDPLKDYQPGAMIPGTVYRVVRLIGAGGMGTVYDVEDMTVGKRYVLKTLHAELSSRRDLAKRMEVEARTLARLSHPNIVEVVTAGATNDELRLPYYVMEKLNGQNLRTILSKKGSLDLPHALHIAIDLLDALDNAHDKGVIHRDVKPDNIFLHRNPNGVTTTKLLDFGIMRLLDAGPGVTAGRFMGTLRYAATEQLRGEALSPQTDLYAAALVLYEMVAGSGPFDDLVDPNKIAAAHIQTAPPPLLSWGVVVPESLERLILGALAKEPWKRPKDAFTFAAQLRNLKRTLQGERPADSETSRPTEVPVAGLVTGASTSLNGLQSSSSSNAPFPTSGAPQAFATTERANTPSANTQGTTVAKVSAFSRTIVGMTAPAPAGGTLVNASVTGCESVAREMAGARTSGLTGVGEATEAPSGGFLDRNASTHSLALEIPLPLSEEETPAIASTDGARTEPWQPQHTLRMDPHAQPHAAGVERVDRASELIALLPASESLAARSDAAASRTVVPAGSGSSRPLLTMAVGLLATAATLATVTLVVRGARRHGNEFERKATGIDGTWEIAPPATAPFAAPILAPPLEIDPSPDPVASALSGSAPAAPPAVAPPASPSAANPATTAEPPQRLRAYADSETIVAAPRTQADYASPSPNAHHATPASAAPPRRKLPGSGL